MRLTLPTAAVILAAALPLALLGCSSGSSASSNAANAADGSTTSAAAPTSTDPDADLPTGTRLNAALAPAAYFPAGFIQDSSGSRNTGDTYQSPTTANAAAPDCTLLGGTGWPTLPGIGSVSFAQSDYINKDTSEELAQEIDTYQGADAQTVLADLAKLATTCPTYTDAQTSTHVKVAEAQTPGLGDDAYTITLTDSAWQTGSTLQAVQVGKSVISVYSSGGADNGADAATKLSNYVVGKLKATS